MAKAVCGIPLSRIRRVEIHINKSEKTLAEIKAATGADYIINGGLFEGTKAVCHLKAAGKVWASDPYTYWGYAWDTGPDMALVGVPAPGKLNYICCVCLLRGGKAERLIYGSDLGGRRPRSAMGLKNGDLCLYCSTDGATPEELQAELLDKGWESAVMLDGGGSSQCDLGGQIITASRKVHNLICVYLTDKREETPMDGITQRMMTKNPCYTSGRTIAPKGIMVHSTAAPGVMAQALAQSWDIPTAQAAAHAIVDDTVTLQTLPWTARGGHAGSQAGTANGTHIAFEICEPQECRLLPEEWEPLKRGDTGWAVERLQRELTARGYDPKGIDGSFGPGCDAALRACQEDLGLEVDGSCGPATLAALADRDGSFLSYDPAETKDYFAAAWGRAVALTAHLCEIYGLDPMTDVLDHSEGHALGIASNHADVGHWFPRHGRSMDDFRAAVRAALAGEDVSELDTAVDKLADAGLIDSPAYWKGGNYSADNVKALLIKWAASI